MEPQEPKKQTDSDLVQIEEDDIKQEIREVDDHDVSANGSFFIPAQNSKVDVQREIKKKFYNIRKNLFRNDPGYEQVNEAVRKNTFIKNPYINELFEEHRQVK